MSKSIGAVKYRGATVDFSEAAEELRFDVGVMEEGSRNPSPKYVEDGRSLNAGETGETSGEMVGSSREAIFGVSTNGGETSGAIDSITISCSLTTGSSCRSLDEVIVAAL